MPRCSKKLYFRPIFVKGKEEGKRRKGKAAIAATEIAENAERLVTEEIEMLKVILYLVASRKN
jgi:hypothetical protein